MLPSVAHGKRRSDTKLLTGKGAEQHSASHESPENALLSSAVDNIKKVRTTTAVQHNPGRVCSVALDPFPARSSRKVSSTKDGSSDRVASGAQVLRRIIQARGGSVDVQPFLGLVDAFLSADSASVLDLSDGCLRLAKDEELQLCIFSALRHCTRLKCVDVRGYCSPSQAELWLQLLHLNHNVGLVRCAGCDLPETLLRQLAEQCAVNRELLSNHIQDQRAEEQRRGESAVAAETARLVRLLESDEKAERGAFEKEADKAKGKIWAQEHIGRVSAVARCKVRQHVEVYNHFLLEKAAEEGFARLRVEAAEVAAALLLVVKLEAMDRSAWMEEKTRFLKWYVAHCRADYEEVRLIEARRTAARRIQRLDFEQVESEARRKQLMSEVRYRSSLLVVWKETVTETQKIAFERIERDAIEARRRRLDQDKIDKERQMAKERIRFEEIRTNAERVRERERLNTRFVAFVSILDREEQAEYTIIREIYNSANVFAKAWGQMCLVEKSVAAACIEAVPTCSISCADKIVAYCREEPVIESFLLSSSLSSGSASLTQQRYEQPRVSLRASALRADFRFDAAHTHVTLSRLESLIADAQAKRRVAFEKYGDVMLHLFSGGIERVDAVRRYGYELPTIEPYVLPNAASFMGQRLLIREVKLTFAVGCSGGVRSSGTKATTNNSNAAFYPDECAGLREAVSLRGLVSSSASLRQASVTVGGVCWNVVDCHPYESEATSGAQRLSVKAEMPPTFSPSDACRNISDLLNLLEYLAVVTATDNNKSIDGSSCKDTPKLSFPLRRTISVVCERTMDGIPADCVSSRTKRLQSCPCLAVGSLTVESCTVISVELQPPMWSPGASGALPSSASPMSTDGGPSLPQPLPAGLVLYDPEKGLLSPFEAFVINPKLLGGKRSCNGCSLTVTMHSYYEAETDSSSPFANPHHHTSNVTEDARTAAVTLGLRCTQGLLSIVDRESGSALIGGRKRINIGAAQLFPFVRGAFACEADRSSHRGGKHGDGGDELLLSFQIGRHGLGSSDSSDTEDSEDFFSQVDAAHQMPFVSASLPPSVYKRLRHHHCKLSIDLGEDDVTFEEFDQFLRQSVALGIPPTADPRPGTTSFFRCIFTDDSDTSFEMFVVVVSRERVVPMPLVIVQPDPIRPLCNHPGRDTVTSGTFSQMTLNEVKQLVDELCVPLMPRCRLLRPALPSPDLARAMSMSYCPRPRGTENLAWTPSVVLTSKDSLSFVGDPPDTEGDDPSSSMSSSRSHKSAPARGPPPPLSETRAISHKGDDEANCGGEGGGGGNDVQVDRSSTGCISGSITVTAIGPVPLEIVALRPAHLAKIKQWQFPTGAQLTHDTNSSGDVVSSMTIKFAEMSLRRLEQVLRCVYAYNAHVGEAPVEWKCTILLSVVAAGGVDPIESSQDFGFSASSSCLVKEMPMLFVATKRRQKAVEGGPSCTLGPFSMNPPTPIALPNCLNGGYLSAAIANGAGPEDLLVVRHPANGPVRLVLNNVTRRRSNNNNASNSIEKSSLAGVSPRGAAAGGGGSAAAASLLSVKVSNKLTKIDEHALEKAFSIGSVDLLSVLSFRYGCQRVPEVVKIVVLNPMQEEKTAESQTISPPDPACSSNAKSLVPTSRRAADIIRLHVREQSAEYGALLSDMRRIAMLASVSRHYDVYLNSSSSSSTGCGSGVDGTSNAPQQFMHIGSLVINRTSFQLDFVPFTTGAPAVTMTEVYSLLDQIGYVCDPCSVIATPTKLLEIKFRACDGPEGRMTMLLGVQKTENFPLLQLCNSQLVYDPFSYVTMLLGGLPIAPYAQMVIQDQSVVPFFDGGLLTVELERSCEGDEIYFMARDDQLKSKALYDVWRQEQLMLIAAEKPVAPEVEELLAKFVPFEGITEMQPANGKVSRSQVAGKLKGEEAKFPVGVLHVNTAGTKISVQLASGPNEAAFFVSKINVMALLNGIAFRTCGPGGAFGAPVPGRRTLKLTLRRGNVKNPPETIVRLTIDVVLPQLYCLAPPSTTQKNPFTRRIIKKAEGPLFDSVAVEFSPVLLDDNQLLKKGFLEIRLLGLRGEDFIFFSSNPTDPNQQLQQQQQQLLTSQGDVAHDLLLATDASPASVPLCSPVIQLGPHIYVGADFIGTLMVAERFHIKIDFDWASVVSSQNLQTVLRALRIRVGGDRSQRRELLVEVLLGMSRGLVLAHTVALLAEEVSATPENPV